MFWQEFVLLFNKKKRYCYFYKGIYLKCDLIFPIYFFIDTIAVDNNDPNHCNL